MNIFKKAIHEKNVVLLFNFDLIGFATTGNAPREREYIIWVQSELSGSGWGAFARVFVAFFQLG